MDTNNILNQFEELKQRVDRLENYLLEQKKPSINVQIDIKDIHLNELNLKELAFHLDKLNIHDLSGMLNLGNNFSPTVHKRDQKKGSTVQKNASPKKDQTKEKSDIQININGNRVPYSIS